MLVQSMMLHSFSITNILVALLTLQNMNKLSSADLQFNILATSLDREGRVATSNWQADTDDSLSYKYWEELTLTNQQWQMFMGLLKRFD